MYKIDFLYKNRRQPHLSHRVGGKEGAKAQGGDSGAVSDAKAALRLNRAAIFHKNL